MLKALTDVLLFYVYWSKESFLLLCLRTSNLRNHSWHSMLQLQTSRLIPNAWQCVGIYKDKKETGKTSFRTWDLCRSRIRILDLFISTKGSFKNYVDHFLPNFDHLPTSGWHVYQIGLLSKVDIQRTTYPPPLVNVVFECPLRDFVMFLLATS